MDNEIKVELGDVLILRNKNVVGSVCKITKEYYKYDYEICCVPKVEVMAVLRNVEGSWKEFKIEPRES